MPLVKSPSPPCQATTIAKPSHPKLTNPLLSLKSVQSRCHEMGTKSSDRTYARKRERDEKEEKKNHTCTNTELGIGGVFELLS